MRPLSVLGGILLSAALAPAGAILDQTQLQPNNGTYLLLTQAYDDNPVAMWQSFTAGVDGELEGIDLRVDLSSDSFTLNVYQGQGTGGPRLNSTTFSNLSATSTLWTHFGLTAAPHVTKGTLYTFAMENVTGDDLTHPAMLPGPSNTDSYPPGAYYQQGVRPQFAPQDTMFRTSMLVPEPGVVALVTIALGSTGLLRRRRKA